jgi:UDP-2-acetamido-3-amino-2,3-dideoxy-glucuronate N-acetyltransferase
MPYTVTEHGDFVENANISPDSAIGMGTKVYAYTTIEENVTIGHNCVVGSNVFIGAGTTIGDGTRIQHGAFICRFAKIGKNVFIGPLAILTDDRYPRVHEARETVPGTTGHYKAEPPVLKDGCSIGAGAIILPGCIIGEDSMVGAGAVVIGNVYTGQTVAKVPAVVIGMADCKAGLPRFEDTDNTFFHD